MSFSWNLCLFVLVVVVAMVTGRATIRHLHLDDKHEVKLEDSEEYGSEHPYESTIHHFARHVLCQNNTGKRAFINVMAQKLKDLDNRFVESFVVDLCRLHSRNDSILDRWVQVLFDTDSDGYISQTEMHYML